MRNTISARRPDCHTPGLIEELKKQGCCNGGNTTPPTLGLAGGALTLTINGQNASVNLRGTLAVDLANTPLGYWLPLT
jgi:hypothetical protein